MRVLDSIALLQERGSDSKRAVLRGRFVLCRQGPLSAQSHGGQAPGPPLTQGPRPCSVHLFIRANLLVCLFYKSHTDE